MVRLNSIDYGNVRHLVNSTEFPSMSMSSLYNTANDYNQFQNLPLRTDLLTFQPSQSDIGNMIQYGLLKRGWDPYAMIPASASQSQKGLTKGQKQVQTLKGRLKGSGQSIPGPEDAGKRGFVGDLLNALGAPGGAVTTTAYDLLNGGNFNLGQDLKQGLSGHGRKTGSDILKELGVHNKIAQGVGGFALDVLLDPTSYLGVGLVSHAGTTAAKDLAKQALKDAGHAIPKEKELNNLIDKAIGPKYRGTRITNDQRQADIARAFGRPVKETVQQGGKKQFTLSNAQPNLPKQYDLQIGIPFTGLQKNLLDLNPALKSIGEATKNTLDKLPKSNNKVLSKIGSGGALVTESLNKMFNQFPLPDNVANLFKQRNYAISTEHRNVMQLGERIDKELGGGYKKNPQVHKAIAVSLDEPQRGMKLLNQLPKDQRAKALAVRGVVKHQFKQIAQHERALGILDPEKVREFYFAHLIDGDPKAIEAAKEAIKTLPSNSLPVSGRFQQMRTFPTLKDLQKFVHKFNDVYDGPGKIHVNMDIGQVLATRKLASEVLQQNAKLFDRMKGLGPQFVRPLKDAVGDPNFVQIKDMPHLEGYAVQRDVANFLKDWRNLTQPGEELNAFTKMLGNVSKMWKGSVTASGTHLINNMIGSVWNNWIMGVRDPGDYKKAMKMITFGKGRALEPNAKSLDNVSVTLPDGTELNGQQIMDAAKQFHVVQAGSESDFLRRDIQDIGSRPAWRKAAGVVQHSAETIDDTARLAGFINQLKKTGDPWAAAMNVKKHLFDYSELSRTERNLFGQIVPFYAWVRKNIPLQIMGILRKPGMFTGAEHAMQEGAKATGTNLENAPGYISNAISIPIFKTSDGNVVYSSPYALPANDLLNFIGALNSPGDFTGYLAQQLSPLFKAPFAIATNTNLFTGGPIDKQAEQTGGKPSSQSVMQYLFSQTGLPYKVSQIANSGSGQGNDQHVTQRAPGALGFTGAREYNPEYFQKQVLPYQYAGQLRREIQDLTANNQTVYTKTELEQAKALGMTPKQVRLLRAILDKNGQRKTRDNIENLYYALQSQGS